MNFKAWLIDLFKDERGVTSIKPVVALIGCLFLSVTTLLNSYSHGDIKPAPELVNAVMIITVVGMGADTVDKFTKKAPSDKETKSEA
jgi:hypothetical protein